MGDGADHKTVQRERVGECRHGRGIFGHAGNLDNGITDWHLCVDADINNVMQILPRRVPCRVVGRCLIGMCSRTHANDKDAPLTRRQSGIDKRGIDAIGIGKYQQVSFAKPLILDHHLAVPRGYAQWPWTAMRH